MELLVLVVVNLLRRGWLLYIYILGVGAWLYCAVPDSEYRIRIEFKFGGFKKFAGCYASRGGSATVAVCYVSGDIHMTT